MLTYEQLKSWVREKENKTKLIIAASFVVVFFVGFGTGSYEKGMRRDAYKKQNNYTTAEAKKPAADVAAQQGIVAGAATGTAVSDCLIKGNIASGGKKIYHIKGGAFYERTNAEQCFNTEKEAVAAGYIKSSK